MAGGKKLLTIFGATGNQGGSIIDVVLASPDLSTKYALRGITRDPSSAKSRALASQGVDMVQADLNDVASLQKAIQGAYGAFGVTDFWAVMSKEVEFQQGRNLFEAAKAAGVEHYVWSSLPWAEKLTGGVLRHVDHFDSKAMVEEYVEENKGEMVVSYYMPAMFLTMIKTLVKAVDGTPMLSVPFPSDSIAWPLVDVRGDGGKYVMGLFEAGQTANGAKVNAVSTWTTPKEIVATLGKAAGKEVVYNPVSAEVFGGFFPEAIRAELVETLRLVGEYSYYGKGAEKEQAEHDRWLVAGATKISLEQWVARSGPWTF
ncbi:hypothetical protein KC363_g9029 [Hortaea werneckii]|uniref:NmrA-like domain-containing protein n=1 Tax=Hortaea werneckii TaxID=91943 RepID=A0A3M7EWB7_HORWE|nr:hypothetical protein KC361_g9441 [Hortaea werneckii]KAI6886068.1 hypothetical protein KC325_g3091 [Hortaea werneckii]KAI6995690.1 hypothetical protein KC359_g3908 [Hortaea werneckii]KAI7140614.1 hypothetical protein KC344_g8588 [Hortaea werneckii]KAI7167516.1 hypothetical protein KC360_g8599 [Hortaea werneckii]